MARVLVTWAGGRTATPLETTPAHLVDVARTALAEVAPDAAFVGGTEIYFTEINRTRPEYETWDGLCYSITPQIHAFTDIDVIENLDAQARDRPERPRDRGRQAGCRLADHAAAARQLPRRRRPSPHPAR